MRRSFTLIELIVVIAIIAILVAVIAPNAFKAIEKAKMAKLIADYKAIKTGVFALYADTGHWTGDEAGDDCILHLEDGQLILISQESCPTCVTSPGKCWQLSSLYNNDYDWPGWDGPYLNLRYTENPWGGVGVIWRGGSSSFPGIYMCYTLYCNPLFSAINNCKIPDSVAEKIDDQYDDGNESAHSGNFWESTTGICGYSWTIVPER